MEWPSKDLHPGVSMQHCCTLTRLWSQSPAQQAREHAGWQQCRCAYLSHICQLLGKFILNIAEQISVTIVLSMPVQDLCGVAVTCTCAVNHHVRTWQMGFSAMEREFGTTRSAV